MELPLFEQVADLIRALTPEELGELHVRAHRRGVKVWFDQATVPKEHYEAQMLARRHIDGRDGMAIEVGFHSEHPKKPDNEAALARVLAHEANWRDTLGVEAVAGVFFGADNWTRVSETWIEPDLDDPELAFELASRTVDYLTSIEPARR